MAITVPYQPVPEVAPSTQATPNIEVSAPIAAFGGTIASAIQTAGKEVEGAGKEIFQRAIAMQELENESMAKDADARYILRVGEIHARYNSLQGQAAVTAYPQYVRDLDTLRRQFGAALPNDRARKLFDASSRQTLSRTVFNGAGHAATQNRAWALGASDARVTAVVDRAAQDADPEAVEAGIRTISEEVRGTQRDLRGLSPEQTDRLEQTQVSALLRNHIRSLSRTEPFQAGDYLNENRHRMTAADIEVAERIVFQARHVAGSRRISEEVNPPPQEGVTGPTLEERINAGMRRAREVAPDDPGFPDFVRDRIITDYNRMNSVRREIRQNNTNIIDGALMGNASDGRLPTSVEELTAISPEVRNAWENLSATDQRRLQRVLAANARGDTNWDAAGTRLRRFQELQGMAETNPQEFLNVDIPAEQMPVSARRTLLNMRQQILRRPEGDPRLRQALTRIRTLTDAAGISTRDDAIRYNQFVGAFQDQLQQYQRDHNKFPDERTTREIASNLLSEQTRNWFFANTRMFEIPVPPDELERFREQYTARNPGREPSDAEINSFSRFWRAREYQRRFGSGAGGQPEQPRPRVPQSQ